MALRVQVRLYGDLGRFAPAGADELERRLAEPTTTKDLIESVGVPHTEVELILVDGEPSSLGRLVGDGERVAAFPHLYALDGQTPMPLRPALAGPPRFVLDGHLGRLAGYLRMLGVDALYRRDASDDALAQMSAREGRVLLTRDRGLLKRSLVVHGYCPRSDDPERQLAEVVARFDLTRVAAPFSRCMLCNGQLEPVEKASVEARLEPKTRRYYDEFARCRGCERVFWKGSHHQRMERLLARVLGERPASG
ncbi:MAG TPA: Mut7-C RNAse domain-containing protein [Chloroflexota bacterium]